jgi:hypothetical protein
MTSHHFSPELLFVLNFNLHFFYFFIFTFTSFFKEGGRSKSVTFPSPPNLVTLLFSRL